MARSSIVKEISNPIKMGIYETSSTLPDGGRLGMKLTLDDGRVFQLAKAGASGLSAGYMCQSVAPVANHTSLAITQAQAIGDTTVTVTLGGTAVAANDYLWGTLHVSDGLAGGTGYKIQSHLAQATTSGNVVINIYDGLSVAIDTTSKGTLTYNPFQATIACVYGGLTASVCGIPLVPVTALYYYWSQTKGLCPAYTIGTVVIGQPVGLGGTTAGACGPITAYTTAVWGTTVHVNATTKFSLINLKLDI